MLKLHIFLFAATALVHILFALVQLDTENPLLGPAFHMCEPYKGMLRVDDEWLRQ